MGILESLFVFLFLFFVNGSVSTAKTFESLVVDLLLFSCFPVFKNKVKIVNYFTYYLRSSLKINKSFVCPANFYGGVEQHY